MGLPSYLPLVRGWRYHIPKLQLDLLSGIPVSFDQVYTVLDGKYPGFFISAAVGTTDPDYIFRATVDGNLVLTITPGDLRDARIYRNQMGEPSLLNYATYIRDFPLPNYGIQLNGDGLPFYRGIQITIEPRTTPAVILGFAVNMIEIYDTDLYISDLKILSSQIPAVSVQLEEFLRRLPQPNATTSFPVSKS